MQLTNLNYADDIALVSQQIEQAQQLLTSIETKVANIGIQLDAKKTEVMTYNHTLPVNITLENSDTLITYVTHFKYMGTCMASSRKDFEIRKALSLLAIHKMKLIWNSKKKNSLNIRNLKATIEPIFLYGSEFWTLESTMHKTIDGCYARLL